MLLLLLPLFPSFIPCAAALYSIQAFLLAVIIAKQAVADRREIQMRFKDRIQCTAVTVDCYCPPHHRTSFLARHKGPYLTKEDITRWWEELKDHEF